MTGRGLFRCMLCDVQTSVPAGTIFQGTRKGLKSWFRVIWNVTGRSDGVSALEKIMEFDKDAKVVMISALGKQDLVKKSLLIGAKNYIVKPLDRKKVLERVVSVLKT